MTKAQVYNEQQQQILRTIWIWDEFSTGVGGKIVSVSFTLWKSIFASSARVVNSMEMKIKKLISDWIQFIAIQPSNQPVNQPASQQSDKWYSHAQRLKIMHAFIALFDWCAQWKQQLKPIELNEIEWSRAEPKQNATQHMPAHVSLQYWAY